MDYEFSKALGFVQRQTRIHLYPDLLLTVSVVQLLSIQVIWTSLGLLQNRCLEVKRASGMVLNVTEVYEQRAVVPLSARRRGSRRYRPSYEVWRGYDVVMWMMAMVYVLWCPFTKVEESFNVQAMYDLLFHGSTIDLYDHHSFPGVVPRTFIGALFTAVLTAPFSIALKLLQMPKIYHLYAVRMVLATLSIASLSHLRHAAAKKFNLNDLHWTFTVVICCQFHLLYYCSRPLPNTFALILCNLANAAWLSGSFASALAWFAFASVVFRSDVVVLAFPLLLMFLVSKRLSLKRFLFVGSLTSLLSILLTVLVDSYFWKKQWIWPEGQVFWFNTVENRSSEWGVSPWYYYAFPLLPKALLATCVLIPFSLLNAAIRPMLAVSHLVRLDVQYWFSLLDFKAVEILVPVKVYIALYSLLPHKELRFVFPALPLLSILGAVGLAKLILWARSSWLYAAVKFLAFCSLFGGLCTSGLLGYISSNNYPGGEALALLNNDLSSLHEPRTVHISNLAATTGVTHFGEEIPLLKHDKTEGLQITDLETGDYDFLISETESIPGFRVRHTVNGFNAVRLDWSQMPPFRIELTPKLFVLEKSKSTT